jgi:hypothetical protein
MKFTRPAEGDPVSAEQNVLVLDELERLGKWSVAAPLELRDTASGFALSISIDNALELPTPQYQFMVYQGVAANTPGFDYVRAHPTV